MTSTTRPPSESDPLFRRPERSAAAESRAADELAARARLDQGRQRLDEIKARQLAEAEALSLAQIRIQTERALAQQAESLRDGERKAELTAIERRSADLEAAKEARRREELEQAAAQAATAKAEAERQAEIAARERQAALGKSLVALAARRAAVREARAAAQKHWRARIRVAWLAFRCASPFKVAIVAGALGFCVALVTFRGASPLSPFSLRAPSLGGSEVADEPTRLRWADRLTSLKR